MPSSPPSPAALYLDTGLALSQIGDTDAMNSMLQMLQESLQRDLPAIADCVQNGDVAGANRMLHALKGFIPIFCQAELCGHVVQVEALSKHGDSRTLESAYAALRVQLQILLTEVNRHLEQLPS